MKREQRRLRFARRQVLLAEVSQRNAMLGLADALAEENRSATLAQRSRALVEAYSGRSYLPDGAALQHAVGFTGALASLATDADSARHDAARQADWQAQALGEAQTRARRQSERLAEAVAAYQAARARRAHDLSAPAYGRSSPSLAQRVQGKTRDTSEAETCSTRTTS